MTNSQADKEGLSEDAASLKHHEQGRQVPEAKEMSEKDTSGQGKMLTPFIRQGFLLEKAKWGLSRLEAKVRAVVRNNLRKGKVFF